MGKEEETLVDRHLPEGFAPLRKNERWQCAVCVKVCLEWFDRCPSCRSFNTFTRVRIASSVAEDDVAEFDDDGKVIEEHEDEDSEIMAPRAEQASKIKLSATKRTKTNVPGIDEMLGGGIVQGQVTFFSGDPGVGKSTLLLMIAIMLARQGLHVFHADAEEPKPNIIARAKRLGATKSDLDNIYILDDAEFIEHVFAEVDRIQPDIVFLNSMNEYMAYDRDGDVVPGDTGDYLMMKRISWLVYKHAHAKESTRPWFVNCHVNAEGDMAGGKKAQHRGDSQFRLTKDEGFDENGLVWMTTEKHKNRFGNSRVKVLFEMNPEGILEFRELHKPKSGGAAKGITVKS